MQVERSIEQEEDSRGKPTWKHMTADFLSSSTIHGLNHLTGTKHGIARAVWLVLVLFHLVYLTYYLSGNVKKLMAYDTVVSTRLQHSKTLSFPAITICNKNNVRKSKIKDHELAGAILLNTNKSVNASAPYDTVKIFTETGHDIKDLLRTCRTVGKKCGQENFTQFVDFQFGRCYTFNADENKPLQTSAEGFNAYIHFTLDTEPDEYSDWWAMSAGIHVIIHNPGEKPELSKNGYLLSPGFSHYISLKREEIFLLEEPFPSACKDVADCTSSCIARNILKHCNCMQTDFNAEVLYITTETEGYRTCSVGNKSCVDNVYETRLACSCPTPCHEIRYNAELSSAHFPAKHTMPHILKEFNVTSEKEFRDRFLQVHVYYRTLSTLVTKEKEAYDFANFFADNGGMMGLFLGCSFISVYEFLGLLFSFFVLWVSKFLPQTTGVQSFSRD